jgi:hypothetical protein
MLYTNSKAGPLNVFKTPPATNRRTLFMPSPSSPLSPCHRRPQIDDAMNSSPSKYKSNNFCITGGAGNDGRCDMGMLPSPPRSPPGFLAPKRLFKPNPIMVRSREESENARRSLFLKKVQNGREDQRMIARGGEDEVNHIYLFIYLSFQTIICNFLKNKIQVDKQTRAN